MGGAKQLSFYFLFFFFLFNIWTFQINFLKLFTRSKQISEKEAFQIKRKQPVPKRLTQGNHENEELNKQDR